MTGNAALCVCNNTNLCNDLKNIKIDSIYSEINMIIENNITNELAIAIGSSI